MRRDTSLDTLLELHGQILVLDEELGYWVRFIVRQVQVTEAKPHGLDYSLTLHGPDDERLVGFDNAHPVRASQAPGGKGKKTQDHKHRLRTVRPYDYHDAATLLTDFWIEVESVLHEKGIVL